MNCKYCNAEFENKGKLMNHYKVCPKKGNTAGEEVNITMETLKEIFSQPVCKSLDAPATCEVAGKTYVLVEPEKYIPYECADNAVSKAIERIKQYKDELAKSKQVDAELDGTIYWPLKRLPAEVSLLRDGQYVSLKCSGKIRGDKVEIEEAKLV